MNKFFTVIVPVYNPKRLERALDSIESQSNKEDIEVIIVDDNSTNKEYQKILSKYTFDYNLIENKENQGPGLARQIGMDNATGEWITFLDHDDEFNSDCFSYIKEYIKISGCEFILTTRIIIADDYDWVNNQQYCIDNGNNHLHGKFYNLQKIKEYGVHFSKDLRAQEDTYFLSLIDGLILLDGSIDNNPKIRMECELISYYWYLWKESTSHAVSQDERELSYLELTFKDYVVAIFTSYKFCSDKYPDNINFKHYRCISHLFYCYLFYESFIYHKPQHYLKENLEYIRNVRDLIIKELNLLNKEDLMTIIMDSADIYTIASQAILTNTNPFIHTHTVQEFFSLL